MLSFLASRTALAAVHCSAARCAARRAASSDSTAPSAARVKIYTRTGDGGTSALFSGERRPKTDPVFEALGTVDELSSALGLAREAEALAPVSRQNDLSGQLAEIQSRLIDVGSHVATPLNSTSSEARVRRAAFEKEHAGVLENWIDAFDTELPPLRNFILPSGGMCAAQLHMARAICRRAERNVAALGQAGAIDASVSVYLNRLSDYLFTAARVAALRSNKPETIYRKPVARE